MLRVQKVGFAGLRAVAKTTTAAEIRSAPIPSVSSFHIKYNNRNADSLDGVFSALNYNPLVNIPLICPTHERPVKIYSFPTPDKVIMEAPTIISMIVEKVDPTSPLAPISDPSYGKITPMIAGPRMLTIRRKKMKKHKRKKRFDRDYFKYQKHHRQKKIKAEKLFRTQMNEMMRTLETFDPLEHVKSTITKAKREWTHDLAPSGKKKYPHWSQLMTLEELYGIEKDDYIDKRAGLPDEETRQQIAQKRKEYLMKYSLKSNQESS